MKDWCIVQFSTGGTEIVPRSWINGEKLSWPPYPPWDTFRIHDAVKRRVHPGATWLTYAPVRLLISHGGYHLDWCCINVTITSFSCPNLCLAIHCVCTSRHISRSRTQSSEISKWTLWYVWPSVRSWNSDQS